MSSSKTKSCRSCTSDGTMPGMFFIMSAGTATILRSKIDGKYKWMGRDFVTFCQRLPLCCFVRMDWKFHPPRLLEACDSLLRECVSTCSQMRRSS